MLPKLVSTLSLMGILGYSTLFGQVKPASNVAKNATEISDSVKTNKMDELMTYFLQDQLKQNKLDFENPTFNISISDSQYVIAFNADNLKAFKKFVPEDYANFIDDMCKDGAVKMNPTPVVDIAYKVQKSRPSFTIDEDTWKSFGRLDRKFAEAEIVEVDGKKYYQLAADTTDFNDEFNEWMYAGKDRVSKAIMALRFGVGPMTYFYDNMLDSKDGKKFNQKTMEDILVSEGFYEADKRIKEGTRVVRDHGKIVAYQIETDLVGQFSAVHGLMGKLMDANHEYKTLLQLAVNVTEDRSKLSSLYAKKDERNGRDLDRLETTIQIMEKRRTLDSLNYANKFDAFIQNQEDLSDDLAELRKEYDDLAYDYDVLEEENKSLVKQIADYVFREVRYGGSVGVSTDNVDQTTSSIGFVAPIYDGLVLGADIFMNGGREFSKNTSDAIPEEHYQNSLGYVRDVYDNYTEQGSVTPVANALVGYQAGNFIVMSGMTVNQENSTWDRNYTSEITDIEGNLIGATPVDKEGYRPTDGGNTSTTFGVPLKLIYRVAPNISISGQVNNIGSDKQSVSVGGYWNF